jgi:hypothetical protein
LTVDPWQQEKELAALRTSCSKKEIDDLLVLFCAESRNDDADGLWFLKLSLAAASLQNCREIASFVRYMSTPAANEIEMRVESVSANLYEVAKSRDVELLHEWYKGKLAPLLNKVEQGGYLMESAARKASGGQEEPFSWSLMEPPGGEEHIIRFGKPADRFKYLEQTCPICGGRMDEMGWCGCGNIGGG